jgi:hypothetical protein
VGQFSSTMYTLYLGLVELEKTVADHAAQLHGRVTHKDTTYEEYAAVTTNTQYGNSTVVMVPTQASSRTTASWQFSTATVSCLLLPSRWHQLHVLWQTSSSCAHTPFKCVGAFVGPSMRR